MIILISAWVHDRSCEIAAVLGDPRDHLGRGGPVNGDDIRLGTIGLLRFKEPSIYGPDLSWAGLSRALKATLDGNAAPFAPPPLNAPQDGLFALLSIACLDYVPQVSSYGEMR